MATAAQSRATSELVNNRHAKQSPPVRLSEAFYKRVKAAALISSRSVPKQLEHLVNIAESVNDLISRKDLLDVQSGLSKLVVEKTEAPRVDKKALFSSLNAMRSSGALSQAVTTAETKYHASAAHPGYLERVNSDGSRDIGMFKQGKFKLTKGLE